MARDLLPAARGGIKPDAHSVFNTLILDEDPMDGSRSLRKRKPTPEVSEDAVRPLVRKRRRVGGEGEPDELAVDAATPAPSGLEQVDEEEEHAHCSPKSCSVRPQRQRKRKHGARVVHDRPEFPDNPILVVPITVAQLDEIERVAQRKQRRRERDRERRARQMRPTEAEETVPHFPIVQTSMYTNPFYAFPDRETDENKGKPYGGILTEAEADTARTYPQDSDRHAFQDARSKAEQAWKEKMASVNGDTTRTKSSGPPSKVKCINFGKYEIDTWHAAPYPEEYSRNKHLYICEFCLKYMSSDYVAWRHKLKCSAKHPPGDEIYRNAMFNPETGTSTTLSFFEVDGRRNPLYCQNLCLLAKLFLGSKTLYYDVEPFLFYIMTENGEFGCHFVGYFSKEKRGCGPSLPPASSLHAPDGPNGRLPGGDSVDSPAVDPVLSNPGNNVSCILVLPVHMRRGFGRVLIEFSYLLTRVEGRTGSPEKPLSDMGLVSYRSYWRQVLCRQLLDHHRQSSSDDGHLSIARLAKDTGMTPDDIISTLEALRALVRDPVTSRYALRLDRDYMREYLAKHDKKAAITLDPDRLCWTPYVMGRPSALPDEPPHPLQTVAPREAAAPPTDTTTTTAPSRSRSSHDDRRTTLPSRPRTPSGTGTGTATPAASCSSPGSIPPTRYEVFPPLPGMPSASRRRPVRPVRPIRPSRPSRLLRGAAGTADAAADSPARRSSTRQSMRGGTGTGAAPSTTSTTTMVSRGGRSARGLGGGLDALGMGGVDGCDDGDGEGDGRGGGSEAGAGGEGEEEEEEEEGEGEGEEQILYE